MLHGGLWGFQDSELGASSVSRVIERFPKGPCTQIAYTLAPKYLDRDYFKAEVYTTVFEYMDP